MFWLGLTTVGNVSELSSDGCNQSINQCSQPISYRMRATDDACITHQKGITSLLWCHPRLLATHWFLCCRITTM